MKKNILIADDDRQIRKMLQRMLKGDDRNIYQASNGIEAVDIVEKVPIDVAILDLKMPEMNGIKSLKKIKQINESIEIIMMTGYGDLKSLRQVIVDYGAFDYLLKPFNKDEVENFVKRALRHRELNLIRNFTKDELEQQLIELKSEFIGKTLQLREFQVKYKNIIERSNDLIIVLQDGYIKYANNKVMELSKYSLEEISGHPPIDLILPEDRRLVAENQKKLIQGKRVPPFIFRAVTKSGDLLWLEVNGSRTMWEERPAVLNIARDCTDQWIIKEKLQKSEEKYKVLTESSLTGIFIHQEGRYVYVNNRFADIHGYQPDELFNMEYLTLIHPEDRGFLKEIVLKKLKGLFLPNQFEIRILKKNGNAVWCEMMMRIIEYEGKSAIMGNILDITERKKTEEALRVSSEQMRNLSAYLQSAREQERTSIAREIHDDLGQMLTAIKMDISWLAKKLPKNESLLRKKTKMMTKLVDNSIQTVKKISSELRPGLLDDLGLVAAIEWMAEDFQDRSKVETKLTIDPEELELEEDLSTAIFRIFQETLTNIVRHARAKTVIASLTAKDGKVELMVEDDGRGIAEKSLSSRNSFGLVGMRERARVFGGRMEIEGNPSKGTKVKVVMPYKTR